MVDNLYKEKIQKLISKAKEKNKIKTYDAFLKTKEADETSLSEDEVSYYSSLKKRRQKVNEKI